MVQCFKFLVSAFAVARAGLDCGYNSDMPCPPSDCFPPLDSQGDQGGPPDQQGGQQGGGGGSGVRCDATGSSAFYSETIGKGSTKSRLFFPLWTTARSGPLRRLMNHFFPLWTTARSVPPRREITSNGCPNHQSYCTGKKGKGKVKGKGKGKGMCGGLGLKGSDTKAKEQTKYLTLPAEPVLRGTYGIGVSGSDVQCQLGAIGIALNGVSIYGGAVDEACTPVNTNAAESLSFDCCSGHSQWDGDYHYHIPPSCLLAQIGDLADGHSPQIGWAYDGFPIYGPKGPGGIDMKFGGDLGPCIGQYCLDECSGLELEIPEVDQFKYRYYVVGATSDLWSWPSEPRPSAAASAQFADGKRGFTLNCYRGYTYSELTGGSSGTTGVASNYTATANAGVTTKYAPAQLCQGSWDYVTDYRRGSQRGRCYRVGFCSTWNDGSCHPTFQGPGLAPAPLSTSASPSPTPSPCKSTMDAAAGGAVGTLALAVALPCLEML